MPGFTKVGLEALLTPDDCVLVLIDHQPFQLANVNSHELLQRNERRQLTWQANRFAIRRQTIC